jgi:branched-chain amino acid transport system substrate-binding protein
MGAGYAHGVVRRVLLLLALLAVPAALASSGTSPGVTTSSIVIGGIAPATGDGAGVAKGAAAYFRYVNDRGGVNGRTIEYRVVDGGDDPATAAQQLVEQDKVFALFGTVGTDAALAIRGYVDQAGVPQLFVATGSAGLGRWTIGFPPSHALEGAVLARQVLKTGANGRVSVLYEDDADGQALLAAFRRGLGARAGLAIPSTTVRELRAGGAHTFVVLGRAVASAGLPAGAVSVTYLKDFRDPRWAGDPSFEKYRRTGGLRTTETVAGMAAAFTLVDALRRAGRTPTRAGVLAAARSLNEANNPFLVPGIVVRPPIQQVVLQRRSGGRWSVFTGPLTVR